VKWRSSKPLVERTGKPSLGRIAGQTVYGQLLTKVKMRACEGEKMVRKRKVKMRREEEEEEAIGEIFFGWV
jgi:hypothetical protein